MPASAFRRRRVRTISALAAQVLEQRILLAIPVANDDAVVTNEDTPLAGNVLLNNGSGADSDADADPLTVTSVNAQATAIGTQITLTSGALLTVNSNGTFTYDPNGRFESLAPGDTDTDSFQYAITDGLGGFDTATVTVTILGMNDLPIAVDDRATTSDSESVQGDLLDNDGDFDAGDTIRVIEVDGSAANVSAPVILGSGSSLIVAPNGFFLYEPGPAFRRLGPGESVIDVFSYTIEDENGLTATASVTITVEGSGAEDIVGFYQGGWWVGRSTGTAFVTSQWGSWANAAWDGFGHGDFNNDGMSDVLGLLDGVIRVGISDGSAYTDSVWATWTNSDWKNVTIGDLNGDGFDDVMARLGGVWQAALSNGAGFNAPSTWTTWADVPWHTVSLVDLNNDGRDDLLAYLAGEWWAGLSNGGTFNPPGRWAKWAPAWDGVGTFDADGDGREDVFGLLKGEWWWGKSNGTTFVTSLRQRWKGLPWADAIVGDFDGDGRDDLAANYVGEWWISRSAAGGVAGATSLYTRWANVTWRDIRVGDFDGDARDDLIGRNGGQWWVRGSTTGMNSRLWATWGNVIFQGVAAVEADDSAVAPFSLAPPAPTGGAALARGTEEEALSRFWANAGEKDELTAELLTRGV